MGSGCDSDCLNERDEVLGVRTLGQLLRDVLAQQPSALLIPADGRRL